MIKGILFDFNGTMFLDSEKHKEAWDVFSRTYRGKAVSEEEMEQMHGHTNKQIIRMLMEDMKEEESARLSEDKEAMYRQCCMQDPARFHLTPGLIELLDQAKLHQIPMTICSASIKANIDFFVSSFHLDRWFDITQIVYDDGTYADKIPMFQEGARRIQVPIEDCIVFEDSLSGIEYAHQCHVHRIFALTTPEKRMLYETLPGVDEILFDFYQFDLSSLL